MEPKSDMENVGLVLIMQNRKSANPEQERTKRNEFQKRQAGNNPRNGVAIP